MTTNDIIPRPKKGRIPSSTPLGRRRRSRPPDLSAVLSRTSARARDYGDFMSVAERFVDTPPSRLRTASGYVLCGAVSLFLGWALFGDLPVFAIAPGEIVSRSGTQALESRVSGSVTRIDVKEGDTVLSGVRLLQLNDTVAIADRTVIRNNLGNLKAEVARRLTAIAAVRKDPVAVHDSVAWADDVPAAVRSREDGALQADLAKAAATIADLQAQRDAKVTSRDKFTANIAAQKSLIEARTERTGMHQQLADKGWDSRATVLQALEPLRQEQVALATLEGSMQVATAAIPVIDREIAETRQVFVTENTRKVADAERQIDGLEQQLVQADKAVDDTVLRAPVAGTVHGLAVTTIGQSIKEGQQLLQIVPQGTPIDVVAYVLNTDIGFVKVGQPATIKVDSFPYTRYGTVSGHVVEVAPDAIPGSLALAREHDDATPETGGSLSVTNPAQQTSDLVFPVVIRPDQDWIAVGDHRQPLRPGMSLAAEIQTERQRAIAYILYPLIRALPRR